MKFQNHLGLFALVCVSAPLDADTVILKNGQKLEGAFLGGNARQIDFLPSSGQTMRIQIDSVRTLTFETLAPPPAPAPVAQPAPPPQAAAREPVLVPNGTAFRVRTIDPIDVDATKAGMKFKGSLDDPIMIGGSVIAPRGADVVMVAAKVAQGGRAKGSDLVELKVDAITVNGRAYQVVTSVSETKSAGEGKKTTRKALGGAGLGALVGGIAGGGKGALIGVAAGAAGGLIISAAGQPHLQVPPETRLEFKLLSDWKI